MALAALLVIGALYGPAALAAFHPDQSTSPVTRLLVALEDEQPGCVALLLGGWGAAVGLACVLLLSGFGLLGARRWGRNLGALYGITFIAVLTAGLSLQFAYVHPALERLRQRATSEEGPNAEDSAPALAARYPTGTVTLVLIGVGFLGIIHAGVLLSHSFSRVPSENERKIEESTAATSSEPPWVRVEWLEDSAEGGLDEIPSLEAPKSGLARPEPINGLRPVQGASKEVSLPRNESVENGQPPEAPQRAEWYYVRDKKKTGPVSLLELARLASDGQLRPGDMVWQAGTIKWVSLDSVLPL
jgi:hypothetical protein